MAHPFLGFPAPCLALALAFADGSGRGISDATAVALSWFWRPGIRQPISLRSCSCWITRGGDRPGTRPGNLLPGALREILSAWHRPPSAATSSCCAERLAAAPPLPRWLLGMRAKLSSAELHRRKRGSIITPGSTLGLTLPSVMSKSLRQTCYESPHGEGRVGGRGADAAGSLSLLSCPSFPPAKTSAPHLTHARSRAEAVAVRSHAFPRPAASHHPHRRPSIALWSRETPYWLSHTVLTTRSARH